MQTQATHSSHHSINEKLKTEITVHYTLYLSQSLLIKPESVIHMLTGIKVKVIPIKWCWECLVERHAYYTLQDWRVWWQAPFSLAFGSWLSTGTHSELGQLCEQRTVLETSVFCNRVQSNPHAPALTIVYNATCKTSVMNLWFNFQLIMGKVSTLFSFYLKFGITVQ